METVTQEKKSPLFISSFILKIVALLTMTIDHVGYMFQDYYILPELASIFRLIGRFALPLFCFMIVEGVLHTRNFKKYCLRLGVAALVIAIAMITIEYLPLFDGFSMRNEGNIFIDLILGATAVYCLNHKKWYIKLLALLPIGFTVGSAFANSYECVACGSEVWIIPFFIRTQYSFYGMALILGFYGAYLLGKLYVKVFANGIYENTKYERIAKNIVALFLLIFINVIFYFIVPQLGITNLVTMDLELQLYSSFAGLLILFYNGKRGYNASWFQYGCYLYYAIHMLLIYGIFALLF